MGDFLNYESQGLQTGKTVEYEVTELRNPDGTHPVVHVEHLSIANATFLEEMLARAGTEEPAEDGEGRVARALKQNKETVAKHCARRIDRVFFSDGTAATDADIPGFIRSLPAKAFHRLLLFIQDEANFYGTPIAGKPGALAEK